MTSQRQVGMLGTQSISVDSQGQANLEMTSVWQRTLQGRTFWGPGQSRRWGGLEKMT